MREASDIRRELEAIAKRLDARELEPRPGRHDLGEQRHALAELGQKARGDLLGQAEALQAELGDADEFSEIAGQIALILSQIAALLHLAANSDALRLLERARKTAPEEFDRRLLGEALTAIDDFVALNYAGWLSRHGDAGGARRVARPLTAKRSKIPTIASVAQEYVNAPTPLTSAPTLFSLNGFGARLYGARDRADDGSYIATRYVTALFVPILPLDAFRVWDGGDGSYTFAGKVPLPRTARLWQWLVLVVALVGGIGGSGVAYWQSTGRRLRSALREAQALETAAHDTASRANAIERYEGVMQDFGEKVEAAELTPAAAGITRLALANVPEPMKPEHLDPALGALRRVAMLPAETRDGGASQIVADRAEAWTASLGDGREAELATSVQLLDAAARVCADADKTRLAARHRALELKLAGILAPAFPLAAIRIYASRTSDPEALKAAAPLISSLNSEPSVWLELAPELASWAEEASAGGTPELIGLAGEVRVRLENAHKREGDPQRKALLESDDEKALEQAVKATPGDQELALALVGLLRGRGEPKAALDVLSALGQPGRLVSEAQLALADVLGDLGEWARAEQVLERSLIERMPRYQAARSDYEAAAAALEERLSNERLPPELDRELEAAPENERRGLYRKWVAEKFEADPELARLGERAKRLSSVVPVALSLGTIQLRHAAEASGAERERLLARAERSFLSIQSEAAGVPRFHLGLGQVYHRLGKAQEGEREFGALLEKKDPDLSLEVARAYRELGLVARARAVALSVYDAAKPPTKHQAATLLSLISNDRDEQERWLRNSNQDEPFVRVSLLEIAAQRLYSEGKLDAADVKFAEAAREHERDAEHNSAAANNAALAHGWRYACTGDVAHLGRAVKLMERSMALEPDNPIAMTNTAPILEHRGMIAVLGRWLKPAELRLNSAEAEFLVDSMLEGEKAAELRSALERNLDVRRARDLTRRAELLAPRDPDVYSAQASWFVRFRDMAGLRALRDRLRRAPALDTSQFVDRRKQWLSGEQDEQQRKHHRAAIERYSRTVPGLDANRDAPSLAALWVLIADEEDDLATLDLAVEPSAKAVEALRKADGLWPAIGAKAALAPFLVRNALIAGSAGSPELVKAVRADLRTYSTTMLVHRLLQAKSSAAVGALRARPELAQAAAIQRELGAPPTLFDWAIGRAAGDTALIASSRAAFQREQLALESEIELLLEPGESATLFKSVLANGPRDN